MQKEVKTIFPLIQTTEPDGKKIRRVMYQHPGNDVTGIIARSEKVAGACEEVKSQSFLRSLPA